MLVLHFRPSNKLHRGPYLAPEPEFDPHVSGAFQSIVRGTRTSSDCPAGMGLGVEDRTPDRQTDGSGKAV